MAKQKRSWGFRRQKLQTGVRGKNHDQPVSVTTEESTVDTVTIGGLEAWQELVLKYADNIPIVNAGARFYGEATKRVRVYLADKNTGEGLDDLNHAANEIIRIFSQYREEAARAVELRYLIGESRHTFNCDTHEWATKGAGELFSKKDGSYYLKNRDGKEINLEKCEHAWRSYDPDRKWSDLATSSHKSMLDVLEAFRIAYAEERAVSIRAAMNAGIVGISEEVYFSASGDEDAVNSEGSGEGAALESRLAQMLSMTINNPRDSASFVPWLLVTPAGRKPSESIEHISITADRDKRRIAERIQMLKEEYAVGADLPADQSAGFMSDMNHWNGRIVRDASWTDYLAPKIQSVYQDAFEEIAEALDIDISGVAIGLDNTLLISTDDASDVGFRAYDRGLISSNAARRLAGLDEDDAPSEEEYTARMNNGSIQNEVRTSSVEWGVE